MTSNPYSTPGTEAAPAPPPSSIELHSPNAVLLATFLGSVLGGGLVIAQNYRRLGQTDMVLKTIAWSFLGGSVLLGVMMLIPESIPIPSAAYLIPQLLGMRALAEKLQGEAIEAHKRAHGKIASKWGAAGLGLLAMIVVLIELVAMTFVLPDVESS